MDTAMHYLVMGHRALRIPGTELAKLLGVTPKTVYRWYGNRSSVTALTVGDLAPHVYPHDAALAERMHAYAARDLAKSGLRPPPPLPRPPPPPAPQAVAPVPAASPTAMAPRGLRAEGVIHAVCKALDVGPRAVRPAVYAAFRRAKELELTVDDVVQELAPPVKKR